MILVVAMMAGYLGGLAVGARKAAITERQRSNNLALAGDLLCLSHPSLFQASGTYNYGTSHPGVTTTIAFCELDTPGVFLNLTMLNGQLTLAASYLLGQEDRLFDPSATPSITLNTELSRMKQLSETEKQRLEEFLERVRAYRKQALNSH